MCKKPDGKLDGRNLKSNLKYNACYNSVSSKISPRDFKTRCAAIVLIAAGYGWACEHYIPAGSNLTAYLFQFIVLGVLLWLAIGFFSMAETDRH